MKENEDNVPNIDIEPFSAYWAEYVQALQRKTSVKFAYMTVSSRLWVVITSVPKVH